MNVACKWIVAAFAGVCSGCVPSLQPLYTANDIVFESGLLGEWVDESSTQTWSFTQADTNAYRVVYTDGQGIPGSFRCHLVKLGETHFLDFYPDEPEFNANGYYMLHLVPAHSFMRIEWEALRMTMAPVNPDAVKKRIEESPGVIAHTTIENMLVFTASTEELQAFLVDLASDEKAFESTIEVRRRDEDAPAGDP